MPSATPSQLEGSAQKAGGSVTENVTIGRVAWELRERVEREEREWYEARLHFTLHHNWLSPDECATCREDADRLRRIAREQEAAR